MKVWVTGLTAITLLGGALALGVATQDGGKLAPGLRIAGVSVGGLTREEALTATRDVRVPPRQVTVTAGNQRWTLSATRLGWRTDLAATVDAALRAGGDRNVLQRVQGMLGQAEVQDVVPIERVDVAVALDTLKGLAHDLQAEPKDASVTFDRATKRYAVVPDSPGRRANAAAAANAYASAPSLTALDLHVTEWKAARTAEMLRAPVERGNRLMRPLTVRLEGTTHTVALTALQVADLYWVRGTGIEPDEKTLRSTFDRLTAAVDQPALNARYAEQGGRLVKVEGRAGHVADRQAALAAFRKAVFTPDAQHVVFAAKVSQPTLTEADLPDPSRLQLITTGVSTYYHSSPERRRNVANAAAKISGVVVPAGEDFSFLQALGGITPENGFVGGLIISGGRTVDGLGGGVCQVSTTTFRALYQAGLPVVERNPHSYRVGYYEPQVGFEAAVYDPGLDLKMKNDTGAPLFIRTVNRDGASRLEVQVWGIKPARQVTVNPAVILSRTPHPPAQYLTNASLRPGTSRQVDWAQDGYTLYISRTIKDASGVRGDRVETTYRPWRAVYEVGPG
ncbi:VanW family protein [Deinococcus hopiensis]|uniref:Vancomycin resistance protein YoaR, contains peptidoglycan-binding and VanW domains n=1 Tax=Deinococcus hopiensis KR-140 TaxID=695939 RepID=A0A1W1VMT8_9DEIO|nr:VanW family protein [Deinococcus hopiensis]SMB94540.1 Vancomycin resistance protein YoaR, contains peptidoglycan-binding and VanW domains [Deinococcus hopiensis KR-140]